MSDRRFTEHAKTDPALVMELPDDHAAMVQNRTLFPTTVVDVADGFEGSLLVSGVNSRKLGSTIEKGRFKGYKLYSLTLEERATCPLDCEARSYCYGNGMQLARRHRIDDLDLFQVLIDDEIRELTLDPNAGLMVRLHVLGDFPSVDYVAMWGDLLDQHDRLACYGYTHRLPEGWGGDDIGDAIKSLKERFGDRFRIRWSAFAAGIPDSTTIIDYEPTAPKIDAGIVCPAQTEATACCATCALCWEQSRENIVFIKHGRPSASGQDRAALKSIDQTADEKGLRKIQPLNLPRRVVPAETTADLPRVFHIDPTLLLIEDAYQRSLTSASIRHISKIVAEWDWAKFKPPICAEIGEETFAVIDGQHTAIAAASHPGIEQILIVVVPETELKNRAESFVSHNKNVLKMSQAQVYHAQVAAGDEIAARVARVLQRHGASIPKAQPGKGYAKRGQFTIATELMGIARRRDEAEFSDIVEICTLSNHAPVGLTIARAVEMIVTEPRFAEFRKTGSRFIAAALANIANPDAEARVVGIETGQSRIRALAAMIEAKAAAL